jgi:ArsR family transcriptional regulator, lead/cadmium/zinc/bismuth-responsive transcriptional repressor
MTTERKGNVETPPKPGLRCEPEGHVRPARLRGPVPEEAFEAAASVFRLAGDVERLKLLDRLCDGEWCVSELAEAAKLPISNVSHQLKVLRAERVVVRRRSGRDIFYSLADRHVVDVVTNVLAHVAEESDA